MPGLDDTLRFIRERTAPSPVPLAPELSLYQATELTPLWHATARELHGWDDSPYWAFPWAGGQALARHVLDHPELVRGLGVVDFATGSGLVAIAAARAGAAKVLAVDVDPFCRAAVLLNAGLNGVEIPFRAADPIGEPLPGVDVLLAGDVFYERALAARALGWFHALAASRRPRARRRRRAPLRPGRRRPWSSRRTRCRPPSRSRTRRCAARASSRS